jgi:tRNA (cytidine/uridine-2'-O-)-methyltransferase
VAVETCGVARHSNFSFSNSDALLFGSETKGLPEEVLASLSHDHVVKLPMLPNSRSLNLANAVSVVVYEAWRQRDYPGAS